MAEQKKVVLITGSSRGIGAGLARSFAEKGFGVVINYLKSKQAAGELLEGINARCGAGTALAIRADVGCRSDVTKMFDQVSAKFKRIDVLINTAGLNIDKPFLEISTKIGRQSWVPFSPAHSFAPRSSPAITVERQVTSSPSEQSLPCGAARTGRTIAAHAPES